MCSATRRDLHSSSSAILLVGIANVRKSLVLSDFLVSQLWAKGDRTRSAFRPTDLVRIRGFLSDYEVRVQIVSRVALR